MWTLGVSCSTGWKGRMERATLETHKQMRDTSWGQTLTNSRGGGNPVKLQPQTFAVIKLTGMPVEMVRITVLILCLVSAEGSAAPPTLQKPSVEKKDI